MMDPHTLETYRQQLLALQQQLLHRILIWKNPCSPWTLIVILNARIVSRRKRQR